MMAKGNEENDILSAPAAPPQRAICRALGAGAAVVAVSTSWRGSFCWWGSSGSWIGADGAGVGGESEAPPTPYLRDGSRALALSSFKGFPRPGSRPSLSLDFSAAGVDGALGGGAGESGVESDGGGEALSIQPIDIPFVQRPKDWRVAGHGISLDVLGEPKSGTTWLGRLVPQLALEACGSWNNLWCKMGGLAITERVPAPSYEFEMMSKKGTPEMLDKETGEPGTGRKKIFLHYNNKVKHVIPGMDKHEPESRKPHSGCNEMGWAHNNGFHDAPPCRHGRARRAPTREGLEACLWGASSRCAQYTTSADPDVRRSFVIFRDPRDVIISEYKMRTEVFNSPLVKSFSSLESFVRFKFKILVSWIHQRWVWHSGDFMGPSSYLVYYEEAQGSPLPLIGMANFMGLECSYDQAFRAWKAHQSSSPHDDYTTHGLTEETIQWMNATMASLLPPPLALRYGVYPTDL